MSHHKPQGMEDYFLIGSGRRLKRFRIAMMYFLMKPSADSELALSFSAKGFMPSRPGIAAIDIKNTTRACHSPTNAVTTIDSGAANMMTLPRIGPTAGMVERNATIDTSQSNSRSE